MTNNFFIVGLEYTKIEGINITIGYYFKHKNTALKQFKRNHFIGNSNRSYF